MFKETFPVNIVEQWDAFMRDFGSSASGQDLYPEIFFKTDLYPLQRTRELRLMIQLARALSPRVVMEIGADKGGSFFHWVKCFTSVRRAIALEYKGTPYALHFKQHFPNVQFYFGDGSSYDPERIRSVEHWLGSSADHWIDCLFIDGDKGGTAQDFAAYAPMVRPGGLVFIHDIVDDIGPAKTFYGLRRGYALTALIDGREGSEAHAREVEGKPCESGYEQWLRIWKWNSCGVGVVHV